ncbi:MAG: hypothetical protein ACRC6V_05680, partial [Bacteroidales bacterium]
RNAPVCERGCIMKNRSEKRKEKQAMFGRLEAAARFKFETFDRLNKDIDAKVTADMTQAQKQALSRQRVVSQRMKAQIVAKQTHVLIDEVGVGSVKGMWNDKGSDNVARGKVKIKQKGIMPRGIKLKGEKR